MSDLAWLKLPFSYKGEKDFYQCLDQWTGHLFYDRLPNLGYEVREEQIYTTFRIIQALREKQVLFAEAGSGTGKTFAYLLPCLCYARMRGKPVIIACSSPILQEQLASPHGDIATLSRQLNLEIDARIAKRPEHYACERKLEYLEWDTDDDSLEKKRVLDWAKQSEHGERSEIPEVGDEIWERVAWDRSLRCERCRRRGACRPYKVRTKFRAAQDLIICEHEIFFSDLWLRGEQKADRRQPYLPDYSAVVFDEAHLIELPMAKSMGRQLSQTLLEKMLPKMTDVNDQRIIVAQKVAHTEKAAKRFFQELKRSVVLDERAQRMHVRFHDQLRDATQSLVGSMEMLQQELFIEESMNEENAIGLAFASFQDELDRYLQGLRLMLQGEDGSVTWWEPSEDSAWVIPREFSATLRETLFTERLPVVFTSATLAVGPDFSYMQQMTGSKEARQTQVGSPFALDQQVAAYVARDLPADDGYIAWAASRIEELLHLTQGRSLVLCSSDFDVRQLRNALSRTMPYRILWEGDAHRTKLIDDFRSDLSSVLVGSGFWEGIDVPGEALSQVIILTLPFPSHDPLVEARRREVSSDGLDPFEVIDIPAMLIKLRQGFGRLIRTATDRGLLSILDSRPDSVIHQLILEALPKGIAVTSDLSEVASRVANILG